MHATILHHAKGNDKSYYKVSVNDKVYRAIFWNGLELPIVYDDAIHQIVDENNWSVGQYALNTKLGYMHKFVMDAHNVDKTHQNDSIDHINEFKLDNRRENLRYVSQSIQNSNRASRIDKLEPLEELKKAGVHEYPRYVRWDKTEEKFVIDKHPALVSMVRDNVRKKAVMSGTKSKKLDVVAKYKDVLSRLEDLDKLNENGKILQEFKEMKKRLEEEYLAIVKAICGDDFELNDIKVSHQDSIEPQRNTRKGRKKADDMPKDCGVTVNMLPRYTYYVKNSASRGDFFRIECADYSWMTSSSKNVETLKKYEMLMRHIDEMDGEMKEKFVMY